MGEYVFFDVTYPGSPTLPSFITFEKLKNQSMLGTVYTNSVSDLNKYTFSVSAYTETVAVPQTATFTLLVTTPTSTPTFYTQPLTAC